MRRGGVIMAWIQFLFGSPQRTGNTVVAVLGLAFINWIFPRFFDKLIGGFVQLVLAALNPFIGLAVLIFIIYMGYRMMVLPFLPGKKRRR